MNAFLKAFNFLFSFHNIAVCTFALPCLSKHMIQIQYFHFFSFQCDKIRQERDEAVRKLEEFQKST